MLCPVRALGYKGFPTNRKRQQVETNSSQPHIRAAANLPLNVCSFTKSDKQLWRRIRTEIHCENFCNKGFHKTKRDICLAGEAAVMLSRYACSPGNFLCLFWPCSLIMSRNVTHSFRSRWKKERKKKLNSKPTLFPPQCAVHCTCVPLFSVAPKVQTSSGFTWHHKRTP